MYGTLKATCTRYSKWFCGALCCHVAMAIAEAAFSAESGWGGEQPEGSHTLSWDAYSPSAPDQKRLARSRLATNELAESDSVHWKRAERNTFPAVQIGRSGCWHLLLCHGVKALRVGVQHFPRLGQSSESWTWCAASACARYEQHRHMTI